MNRIDKLWHRALRFLSRLSVDEAIKMKQQKSKLWILIVVIFSITLVSFSIVSIRINIEINRIKTDLRDLNETIQINTASIENLSVQSLSLYGEIKDSGGANTQYYNENGAWVMEG